MNYHLPPKLAKHERIKPKAGALLESVEALSHRGFWLTYGIDLLAVADALWEGREA